MREQIDKAVQYLRQADGLLITAGAGMGVDSGLPDFRGDAGFWKAYPPLAAAGISFMDIANPSAFRRTPTLAWGFYGHRLNLYRETVPHAGFALLQAMAARMAHGSFVFTSNVDGQFQKAGFDPQRIVECHGSIHVLQCSDMCTEVTLPADTFYPVVDVATCRLTSALPRCPHCGELARPNILMFGDDRWIADRTELQEHRLDRWLETVERLVIIELGAGTAIASVRRRGERLNRPLIRINPREAGVRGELEIGLEMGALAGIQYIRQVLFLS